MDVGLFTPGTAGHTKGTLFTRGLFVFQSQLWFCCDSHCAFFLLINSFNFYRCTKRKGMSNAETITKVQGLPFGSDEEKAAVITAAIQQDFGPLVEAMILVDKNMLTKSLVSFVEDAKKRNLVSGDKVAQMVDAADERDRAILESQQTAQREITLEPCTLSTEERQTLLQSLMSKVQKTPPQKKDTKSTLEDFFFFLQKNSEK